jgi:hypothetical protein
MTLPIALFSFTLSSFPPYGTFFSFLNGLPALDLLPKLTTFSELSSFGVTI